MILVNAPVPAAVAPLAPITTQSLGAICALSAPGSQVMVCCAPAATATVSIFDVVAKAVVEEPTDHVIADEVATVIFIDTEDIVDVAFKGF